MQNLRRVLFASLAVRDFRNLWLGNFASTIGYWTQTVGQGWLAYILTDSAAFLRELGVARALPALVVTLPRLRQSLTRSWRACRPPASSCS
jgi:hypothetical protein